MRRQDYKKNKLCTFVMISCEPPVCHLLMEKTQYLYVNCTNCFRNSHKIQPNFQTHTTYFYNGTMNLPDSPVE